MISLRARVQEGPLIFDHPAPVDGEEIGRCTLDALERGAPTWITWPFRFAFAASPDSPVPSVLDGIKGAPLAEDPRDELHRRVLARRTPPPPLTPREGSPSKDTSAKTASTD